MENNVEDIEEYDVSSHKSLKGPSRQVDLAQKSGPHNWAIVVLDRGCQEELKT